MLELSCTRKPYPKLEAATTHMGPRDHGVKYGDDELGVDIIWITWVVAEWITSRVSRGSGGGQAFEGEQSLIPPLNPLPQPIFLVL